jgi:hypothetical protein
MSAGSNNKFEVLSPWAEADPIPLKGISPRVDNLEGKTIGLFVNNKRAASPIQDVVEQKMKERYPSLNFSRYYFSMNLEVSNTDEADEYRKWIDSIDTMISAVGD